MSGPMAQPSAEILLRGNLRVVGSIRFDPDLPPVAYNCRFEKVEDGIVVWIDAVEEFESVSIQEKGLLNIDETAPVSQNTTSEGAVLEQVAVKLNDLVGEDLVHVIHFSSAPVVFGTDTVASGGEVTSPSPKGPRP